MTPEQADILKRVDRLVDQVRPILADLHATVLDERETNPFVRYQAMLNAIAHLAGAAAAHREQFEPRHPSESDEECTAQVLEAVAAVLRRRRDGRDGA